MKLAYYPGCSGHGTSKEYESSTRAVCRALGLEFAEIEDWSCAAHLRLMPWTPCCPGPGRPQLQADRAYRRGGRGDACPSCLANLKLARHRMQDAAFKARVDALLDSPTVENAEACPKRIPYCRSFWSRSGRKPSGPA